MKRLGLILALGLSSTAPVTAETYHCPAGQMYRVSLDTCVTREAFYAALARFGYRPKAMPAVAPTPKPAVAATRCPVLTVAQVVSPPMTPALAALPAAALPEPAPEPTPEIPFAATGPASLNPLAWQPPSLWHSPLYVVN